MSGTKFLLDTNYVIGLFKANRTVVEVLDQRSIVLGQCAFSFITRIELLGFSGISEIEIEGINSILKGMQYLAMTMFEIEKEV